MNITDKWFTLIISLIFELHLSISFVDADMRLNNEKLDILAYCCSLLETLIALVSQTDGDLPN